MVGFSPMSFWSRLLNVIVDKGFGLFRYVYINALVSQTH